MDVLLLEKHQAAVARYFDQARALIPKVRVRSETGGEGTRSPGELNPGSRVVLHWYQTC